MENNEAAKLLDFSLITEWNPAYFNSWSNSYKQIFCPSNAKGFNRVGYSAVWGLERTCSIFITAGSTKGKPSFVLELLVRRVRNHVLSLYTNCRHFRDTGRWLSQCMVFFSLLRILSFVKQIPLLCPFPAMEQSLHVQGFKMTKLLVQFFYRWQWNVLLSLFPLSTTRYYSNILLHPPVEQNRSKSSFWDVSALI